MSGEAWFKFYPSDWLAGTRGMSPAETGVYITLVAMMYERGEPIDIERSRLARLCGCPAGAFARILDVLLDAGKIFESDNGLWNDRVGEELARRTELRAYKAKASRKRWGEQEQKDKENQRSPDASGMQVQCYTRDQIPDSSVPIGTGAEAPGQAKPKEADPSEPERQLFQRGREVLGKKAGSLIAKLLRSHGGNVALTRAVIERASQADNPTEFAAGALRKAEREGKLAAGTAPPRAPAPAPGLLTDAQWREQVQGWLDRGRVGWRLDRITPSPADPRCLIPSHILAEFGLAQREDAA